MANESSNVVDLQSEFFWKQLKNRLKRDRDAIDVFPPGWDGGTIRVTQDDEVHRPTDLIILNESAAEVREWFTRFGFPMPETWAEYRAGQQYIEKVVELVNMVRIGYHHIPQHGFEFIQRKFRAFYEPFVFAMQDDWQGVAGWHKQHKTFAKIVREYDESKELPDFVPGEHDGRQ